MADDPVQSRTWWHRLSPYARNSTGTRGLRAEVRDPLWLLGRQWQVGEFAGEDAGSPIKVDLWYDTDVFERVDLDPRSEAGTARDYDPTEHGPLETVVEREPVTTGETRPGREVAAEAGRYFLTQLDERDYRIDGERVTAAEFPEDLHLGPPEREVDAGGKRFLSVARGRTLDGYELYTRLTASGNVLGADDASGVSWGSVDLPAPTDGSVTAAYRAAAKAFADWYADLYDEPESEEAMSNDEDAAWNTDRMEYEFRAAAGTGDDETVFDVSEYPGGRLDWDAFSVAEDDSATLSVPAEESTDSAGSVETVSGMPITGGGSTYINDATLREVMVEGGVDPDRTLVPTKVTFPGMPSPRWWEFEDGEVNLNKVNAGPGELGKLLVTEYALLFGNDWFQIDIDVPVGSLTRVTGLTITDTFGEVTRALPTPQVATTEDAEETGEQGEEASEGPLGGAALRSGGWNAFMHTDLPNHDRPGTLLPPTLSTSHGSDPVERVVLARDEVANAAFGVELVVEDAVGDPLEWREYVPATLSVAAIAPDADVSAESIRLENPGEVAIEVEGWAVESDTGETYTFPAGATVAPGESVTLHTGSGTDLGSDRYWGRTSPVWDGAAHVTVRDGDGDPVDSAFVGSPADASLPDYHLVTDVPENWFPLRMRREEASTEWAIEDLRFELSRILDPDPGIPEPSGQVLEPGLRLYDEELTRAGLEVTRQYQYARWLDGDAHLWAGRRAGAGRGEGTSSLRYDVVRQSDDNREVE